MPRAAKRSTCRTRAATPRAGRRRLRRRMALIVLVGGSRCALVLPFVLKNFVAVPADPGDGLRAGDPRPQSADRLQRPVLARAQRVLRDRRLHRGDHDGTLDIAYFWTLPGRRRWSASSSASCSACRRCGSKASIWRSPPSRSPIAMPQILKFELPRALDRRRAGHRHHQARRRRSGCRSTPTSGSISSPRRSAVDVYVCAANLVESRTGRAIMAIRDNPIAASAMGINIALYKSLTFGVSALYTGVAGALGAIAIQFVAPDSFTFLLSVALLVGLVVGGVGSIPGTLFGGAVRAVRAEHRRARLEGAGRRGLRRHPAAADLPDAVRRRRPGSLRSRIGRRDDGDRSTRPRCAAI